MPLPPEVAGVAVVDAAQELGEIDRQLAALARRIDANHAAQKVADVEAQARIIESATAEYQRILDAQARAEAEEWEALEVVRLAFLADLCHRGVFQTPPCRRGEGPSSAGHRPR